MKKITADSIGWSDAGVWGINNQLRILYRYSSLTGKIDYLCQFPDFICATTNQISVCRNKVFLYPYWNRYLFVFSMNEEKWYKIEINESLNQYPYTYYIGIVNQVIYMYISSSGAIVELDTDTLTLQKYYIPAKYVSNISSNDIKCVNESVILPVYSKNAFLSFNIKSKKIQECVIQGFSNGVLTVAYDENYYWITGKDRGVVKWDEKSNKTIKSCELPYELEIYAEKQEEWIKYAEMESETKFPFLKSTIVENKLWLFPYQSNMILQIDIDTEKYEKIVFHGRIGSKKTCEYLGLYEDSKQLVIRDYKNDMYSIDPITAEVKKILIVLNDEQISKVLDGRIIVENDEISVIDFWEREKTNKMLEIQNVNAVGKEIYIKVKD